MNRNLIITVISIFIVIISGFVFSYYISENNVNTSSESLVLSLYSEGPLDLSLIIEDIKSKEYYKGYNIETLKWMESLSSKKVFFGEGIIVIMNTNDANKIPSVYGNDAYFNEIINCNLIENHSLLTGNHSRDVYYVNNVEYLREEVIYTNGV